VESLAIRGYEGRMVPNSFLKQQKSSGHLAVIFPGMGYKVEMPVLYYPARLLERLGADLLKVEYDYRRPGYRALPEEEQNRWFEADIDAVCEAVHDIASYRRITLIGKSLGTLAMARAASVWPEAVCVWLTPLLRYTPFRARLEAFNQPSLWVIGTTDTHYDAELVEALAARPGHECVVLDEADHSLEVPGEIERSLDGLKGMMRALQRFLERNRP
jgi:pimeloyl-ACP methyl ester carboxylesterase